MVADVNLTPADRANIQRQIDLLVTQIKNNQGCPKTETFDPVERCNALYKSIANLERQLHPVPNAMRSAA